VQQAVDEDEHGTSTAAAVGIASPSKLPRRAGAAAVAADVAAARGRAAGTTGQGTLAQRLLAGAGQLPGRCILRIQNLIHSLN
jgi:hypothetical protein